MHPGYGLRSFCSASDIAYFEYTSIQASESIKRMIFGMHEGMTDHEVVALGGTCEKTWHATQPLGLDGQRRLVFPALGGKD